jgi:hypothetical protein
VTARDHYSILGIEPGASEKQIKAAYRKKALQFHPDLNPSADAHRRFQELNESYEFLLQQVGSDTVRDTTYDDRLAREVYRREHERMRRRAEARREQKRKEEEFFEQPEWHDPILLAKYTIHTLALLIAAAALVGSILLAIFGNPESLVTTFFVMLAGVVLCIFVYRHRKRWFRLGKFKTTWKEAASFMRMAPEGKSSDRCFYRSGAVAGGKPYRIELLRTLAIRVRSYGALDHDAHYRHKVKKVSIPRSARAHFFHRLSSLVKVASLLGCMLFFPVESLVWRFITGIAAGGVISALLLAIARVRSKVSYLFTPGLILKSATWIIVLSSVSIFGPGFNIQTTGYIYLAVAGLFFLLDMVFDLVMGIFPFYKWLFRPLIKQGKIMDALYREGFQNYQEFPIYSVLFPLFRWMF